MKQAFAVNILLAVTLLNAWTADLIDIRYGSYVLGEFIASDTRDADECRIIFEFNHPIEYSAERTDGQVRINIMNAHSQVPQNRFEIHNGLISMLELKQEQDILSVAIYFEGTYESHTDNLTEDPVRLVLTLRGKPIANETPIVTPRSDTVVTKPVIRRVGTTQTVPVAMQKPSAFQYDNEALRTIFPDDRELYLDLFEVPLQQVLRYFSKRSNMDIVPDGTLDRQVTLSIKNQRISEAFEMVLQSQGLSFYVKDSSVIVSHQKQEQANEDDYTLYAVYLRNIDVMDMKVALDFFLPENHFILPDRRSNKLDIYLPREQVSLVDSLVSRYDAPTVETTIRMQTVMLKPEDFRKIGWNADGEAVLSVSELEKLNRVDSGDAVRASLPIHQKEYCREMKRKAYKTGVPVLSSSRIVLTSGYEAFLTLHMGGNSHFALDVDLTWHIVNPDLVQSDDRVQFSADLDTSQALLVHNNRVFPDERKFDSWLESEPVFLSDSIPVLILTLQ